MDLKKILLTLASVAGASSAFADPLAFASVFSDNAVIQRDIQAPVWGVAEPRAKIELTILRLALYEMVHRPDIPTKVAINEAIELAKKYSTEKSGPFVNGVLDAVLRKLRENEPEPEES